MRTITNFPHEVEEIENVFIAMSDGARLAARVWHPVDALRQPVPALLEYLPYRKRDITRGRDSLNHPYLAGHGYATVRVDMRGSGDSDGVLTDEYEPQEIDDAIEVIAWLAEQRWCDGNVGMFGISWGGFNSLMVAARRPPQLKAIISASATEDLYLDNMHYMGGCLLADNLSEATVMFAFNSLPPDPAIVGDRWEEMWRQRLEGSGLWLEKWLEHQHRDAYWSTASVREDYGAVQCPVMAVGGWADGYTNAIFRLMRNLDVPRKALIGPWGHRYPHDGVPGPAIGFLQECVRWWDHWLKGIDIGVMDEPMIRAWMQQSVPPDTSYEERPGHWVAADSWPSDEVADTSYRLMPNRLVHDDASRDPVPPDAVLALRSPLSVGMFAGKWASYAAVPDLPYDQREEDGGALVFETAALDEDLDIFGQPRVLLELESDQPVAMIAARLSDVAPQGEATRFTYGLLNLTHRAGSGDPQPLEPGKPEYVEMELNGIGQTIPAGHRLRLSLSTSYWPLAWPAPRQATVRVHTAASRLIVPVHHPRPRSAAFSEFGEPEAAPPVETRRLRASEHRWLLHRDLAEDRSTLEIINDQGDFELVETGVTMRRDTREWYSANGNDVTSVRGETRTTRRLQRGDWGIEVVTRTVLTCDAETFHITAELDAFDLDESRGRPRVHSQDWQRAIPRNLV